MYCTECGYDIPDGARFCPDCGKAVTPAERPSQSEDAEEAGVEPAPPEEPEKVRPEPEPAVAPESPPVAAEASPPDAMEPPPPHPEIPRPIDQPSAARPPESPSYPPSAAASPPEPPGDQPPAAPPPGPLDTGVPPLEEEPKKSSGAKWCLLGCVALLVVAILGVLVLGGLARWFGDQIEEMPDRIDPIEHTEQSDPDAGATEEDTGGLFGDAEDRSDLPQDLGALIGRIGEAIGSASEAISSASVDGFRPGSVQPDMLPAFYGFMLALAQDSPHGMHQWMGGQLREDFKPADWTVATNLVHEKFVQNEHNTRDDGTEEFLITETARKKDSGESMEIPWEVHFQKVGGRWLVTFFE